MKKFIGAGLVLCQAITWFVCVMPMECSVSEVPHVPHVRFRCNDGVTVNVPVDLARQTMLADLIDSAGEHGADGGEQEALPLPCAAHNNHYFTSAHARRFFRHLGNPRSFGTASDAGALEIDLVLGDFFDIGADVLKRMALRLTAISPTPAFLRPITRGIVANIISDHLVDNHNGTYTLDLHNSMRPQPLWRMCEYIKDPIKVLAFLNDDLRNRVTSLVLSGNEIDSIDFPRLLALFRNLRSLDLSQNNLTSFSATLPKNFRLNLSNNDLRSVTLGNDGQDGLNINCTHNANFANNEQQEFLRSLIQVRPRDVPIFLGSKVSRFVRRHHEGVKTALSEITWPVLVITTAIKGGRALDKFILSPAIRALAARTSPGVASRAAAVFASVLMAGDVYLACRNWRQARVAHAALERRVAAIVGGIKVFCALRSANYATRWWRGRPAHHLSGEMRRLVWPYIAVEALWPRQWFRNGVVGPVADEIGRSLDRPFRRLERMSEARGNFAVV